MVITLLSIATFFLGVYGVRVLGPVPRRRRPDLHHHRGQEGRVTRRVRLHLLDGNGQPGETFEGLQVGRRPIAGHYVLIAAKHLEAEDRSNALEGRRHEFPKERVLFVQVLA